MPMVFLVIKAFAPVSEEFDNWQLVKMPTTWVVMGRSILVGLASATFCLLIGFAYAYFSARSTSKMFRIFALSFLVSPLFVFTIVKVLALKGLLLAIFDESSLNNLGVLILGLTYLNLPFMIIPLYSVLLSMPRSLIEASEDLGVNRFLTIWRVVIPYTLRALAAGFALVFMLAATSIIVSEKLIPMRESYKLIGNFMDNARIRTKAPDGALGSTIALITIVVMMSIYGLIYLGPTFWRKLRGGINV